MTGSRRSPALVVIPATEKPASRAASGGLACARDPTSSAGADSPPGGYGNEHRPPTWSPDGTRIAFTSDGTKDNSEIYAMNSEGSDLTKLTDDRADDTFPTWRP